jgi:hypothetical protein
MRSLALVIGTIGFTILGFEYESGWCFVAAFLFFLEI